MLLEFSVENFMSFNKISTLSMISSSERELPEHIVSLEKSNKSNLSANRVAALFGANASGKSNFLSAMGAMVRFVTRFGLRLPGPDTHSPSKKLPYVPFKFTPHDDSKPSSFQMIFTSGKKIYRYGFSHTEKSFTREWLYFRPSIKKNEELVFDRIENEIQCSDDTIKQYTKHITERNLFFTILAELNVEEYARLILFFQNIVFRTGYSFDVTDIMSVIDEECFPIVSNILEFVDTGLSSVTKEDAGDLQLVIDELSEKAKKVIEALEEFIEPIKEKMAYKLLFQHDIFDNKESIYKKFSLDAHEESRGTIVFIGIIANIISSLMKNSIVIIDEIDSSLHPLLVEGIINLFTKTKNSNSQVIFTSHCPFIFDNSKIRRDELWIVEKNNYGESSIVSASSFKARVDGNLVKQYMEGRFGGIPAIQYKHLDSCSDRISMLIKKNK